MGSLFGCLIVNLDTILGLYHSPSCTCFVRKTNCGSWRMFFTQKDHEYRSIQISKTTYKSGVAIDIVIILSIKIRGLPK